MNSPETIVSTASDPAEQILLLDELRLLIQETSQFHAIPKIKDVFQEAFFDFSRLTRRIRFRERYVLAVIGLSNVGKSTLLNALLGEDVAPRKNGPWTSTPIEFEHGDQWEVSEWEAETHQRPFKQKRWSCGEVGEVQRRLSELATGDGDATRGQARKIVVRAPNDLLQDGLVLADTPGFGAPQPETPVGLHEKALKDYLQCGVAQFFWVVLPEQGIGKTEKEFYEDFLAGSCLDLIVNETEAWEAQDRARWEQRFLPMFKKSPAVHWVSALRGLKKEPGAQEASGIRLLEQKIRGLAKLNPTEALIAEANDIAAYLRVFRDSRRKPLSNWWRPDSWHRWLARAPSCARLKETLTTILQQAA